jgi:dUTP pyrophosphatase
VSSTLSFVRLRPEAIAPTRAHEGDAGLDLASSERVAIGPGERAVVGTGIAVAIPPGYAGLLLPRSGLAARHGLGTVNSPGLIDSGYRGELKLILLNTDRDETFVVERGMRIGQLVLIELPEITVEEVSELPRSERGERGLGSSGV